MTKLQLQYDLVRPLTEDDGIAISDLHGVYGFARVRISPSGDRLVVEYDASRLSEKDVEGWLIRYGLPIRRHPILAA
jgi:hypothetical protein